MTFNELAVVFAVVLSLVGLGLWARRLSGNRSARRWLISLPAMLPVMASLQGIGAPCFHRGAAASAADSLSWSAGSEFELASGDRVAVATIG